MILRTTSARCSRTCSCRGSFPIRRSSSTRGPRALPGAIQARYDSARRAPGFVLRTFVEQNFVLPQPAGDGYRTVASQGMVAHVNALWPVLTRPPDTTDLQSSLIPLPSPYVVPGGRFREIYYWDSYFTMQGLVKSGHTDLVKHMLDNFAHLIRTLGHIPNGNRTYYLTRSQPPYFAAMVALYASATDTARALPYLDALEKEYAFWMDGGDQLKPGQFYRRAVRMPEGVVLNRYWDDSDEPRPESYRPDVEIGMTLPDSLRASFYRNVRASAESGWDFSSRWMRDPKDLRTLETTDLLPVDLNSLLYNAERVIAALRAFRKGAGDEEVARRFTRLADERQQAIHNLMYDPIERVLLRRPLALGRAGARSPVARRRGATLLRRRHPGAGRAHRGQARSGVPEARRFRHDQLQLGAAVGCAQRLAAARVAHDRRGPAVSAR